MAVKIETSLSPALQLNTQNNQGMNATFAEDVSVLTEQHLNTWRRRNTANLNMSSNNESDENSDNEIQEPEQQHSDFYWNTVPLGVYQKDLEEAYNKTVYWRKNIFTVPTGALNKKFIDEFSRLLNL